MNVGIYKQGEGYWTRLMSFMGVGIMFAWGAAWLAGQLSAYPYPRDEATGQYLVEPRYVQGGAALVVLLVGVVVAFWFAYNKPATGEFLIATEGEMRKVNWSTRKEVQGSTIVVVSIALLLGALLFSVDLAFSALFKWVGVLQSGA